MKTLTFAIAMAGGLALAGSVHAQTAPGSAAPAPAGAPPPAANTGSAPTASSPAATTLGSMDASPAAPPNVPPAPPPAIPAHTSYPRWMAELGTGILLGGGFEQFTTPDLRDMTSAAGSWSARVFAGTRQFVGGELAYVGASRDIRTTGSGGDTRLVSNGVEGNVRLDVPIASGRSMLEPFIFLGFGWQRYRMTNAASATSDVAGRDDVLTLPWGGGLEVSYAMFIVDVRYTYRHTYRNDLLRTTGGRLDNWGLGGNVGVQF